MTYLGILVLMLLAFTVVGWPLISSSRAARSEVRARSPWDDLISQRDAAYQAIQELDFEHQLGNLSKSDYQSLRERYRGQAAAVLQKLDAALQETSEASAGGQEAATGIDSSTSLPCPSCGQLTEPADRYCWGCGSRLEGRCPACGGAIQAGDRFCVECGTPLKVEA